MNHRAPETAEQTIAASESTAFAEQMPPEAMVGYLIDHAVRLGASDVFFTCGEFDADVSVRRLGIIQKIAVVPHDVGVRCMAHIRAAAGMKFHDRRIPQDGRWLRHTDEGEIVDLRLNSLPTLHGESFALRILHRNPELRRIDSLGMSDSQISLLKAMLHTPSGMILITGPVGTGKTTTLYACLEYLNDGRRKIHTIEDPVEYTLAGVHQSQVDDAAGATFAHLLRSLLRQGPDVIMVGEIRDQATAETAIRAANSGQLVFASLHAPVAAAAMQTLLSLEIPPHFVATALLGIICQRLVRTLSPETRVAVDLSESPETFGEVREWLTPEQGAVVYAAPKMEDGTEGYVGRTGVFEILTVSPAIREMIRCQTPAGTVTRRAVAEGMLDVRCATLIKIAQGVTSFDELFRIVPNLNQWSVSAPVDDANPTEESDFSLPAVHPIRSI